MSKGRIVLKTLSNSRMWWGLKHPESRALFVSLLTHADSGGDYLGETEDIKYNLMSRSEYSLKEVEEFIRDLETVRGIGMIYRYKAENGDMYIHIKKFEKTPGIKDYAKQYPNPRGLKRIEPKIEKKTVDKKTKSNINFKMPEVVENAKDFINWYGCTHLKAIGEPYAQVNWGRDGKIIQNLLEFYPIDKLQHMAGSFLFDSDTFADYSIPIFKSQTGKLALTLKAPKVPEHMKSINDQSEENKIQMIKNVKAICKDEGVDISDIDDKTLSKIGHKAKTNKELIDNIISEIAERSI